MPAPVAPSHEEPLVRGASNLVGGPLGRHARVGEPRFWTPLRVLLALTILTFTLGWVQKLPCHDGGYGERNFYAYTRLCYSDVYALYYAEGLNEGKVPYVDHPVEYPVVIGGAMELGRRVVDQLDPPDAMKAGRFYDSQTILLGIAALVVTATTVVLAGRRRPWDAALVALAPGLLIHGTTNWDLLAAATTGIALACWAKRKPALAGLWLGAGVATKLYPVLLLPVLLVLCLRAGRVREWLWTAGTAIATVALIYVPMYRRAGYFAFSEGDPERNATLRFLVGNRDRPADWDSLWYFAERVMQRVRDNPGWRFPVNGDNGDVVNLNVLVAVAIAVSVGAVLLLALAAPRRPRVAQVAFLVVAAFLLANKVNSPQFTIWLIPLAALARPRWGAFLAWQAAEVAVLFTRFYFFVNIGESPKGLPVQWFLGAIALRDIALITLMGLVVREMWRPEEDVVRRAGYDDPAGGVLVDEPRYGTA